MVDMLLTNEMFVKSLMNISDNVSTKYLLPAIREAQEIRLRSIIGDCLLESLKGYVSSGDNIPEQYIELLDRCQYVLAYMTAARVIPKVTYKIGNFGLVKTSDENQQVASSQEMDKMVEAYINDAVVCVRDLQRWLLENRSEFPELRECDCNRMMANLYSSASCGLWLGGARGKYIRPFAWRVKR